MSVRYWVTRNDANHDDRHAEVDGIKFFAFPYQPYSGRLGNTAATVSRGFKLVQRAGRRITVECWHANVRECLADGSTKPLWHITLEDKDAAFEWAASMINKREKGAVP